MSEPIYRIVCGRCECEFEYNGPFTVGKARCEACGHSLRDDHAAAMSMFIDPNTREVPAGLTLPPAFR